MKLTNVKAMLKKGAIAGLLAGAVALAAPAKADAQVVVRVGYPHYAYGYGPRYVGPAYGYYGPAYYGRLHHPYRCYGPCRWR